MVSGPLSCGKSSFIRYLDENALNVEAKGIDDRYYTVGMDLGCVKLKLVAEGLKKAKVRGTGELAPIARKFHVREEQLKEAIEEPESQELIDELTADDGEFEEI